MILVNGLGLKLSPLQRKEANVMQNKVEKPNVLRVFNFVRISHSRWSDYEKLLWSHAHMPTQLTSHSHEEKARPGHKVAYSASRMNGVARRYPRSWGTPLLL